MKNNLITIVITTYNLDKYISKCLDSILSQNVQFNYNIIIADDSSTDKTLKILRAYEKKYTFIKILSSNRNLGSLSNSIRALELIDSPYFVFIDGDDYFINDNKLQHQIEFMENNLDFSMCGGNTKYLKDNEYVDNTIPNKSHLNEFDIDDFIDGKGYFIHTSSLLYRNIVYNKGIPKEYKESIGTLYECAFRGEDIRFLDHLLLGKVKIFDEDYSVYRIHSNGMWQGSSVFKKNLETTISKLKFSTLFPDYKEYFYNEFKKSYKHTLYIFNETLLFKKNNQLLKQTEINSFLELYNILKEDENINLTIKHKKISLKNKLRLYCYTYFKNKLDKKGLI